MRIQEAQKHTDPEHWLFLLNSPHIFLEAFFLFYSNFFFLPPTAGGEDQQHGAAAA
jgi:hypothetical protein